MTNISAAEILKMHGKWIRSNDFHKLVAQKLKITERQAYNLTKNSKEIIRITLQDRTVIYGLPEFGLPQLEKNEEEKIGISSKLLHESTKAQAINKLRAFEALSGYTFSQDEWQHVLSAATDKEMLDRCDALLKLKRLRSLL